MFRFFLKKKVLDEEITLSADSGDRNSRAKAQDELRNRRNLERFPINHKHLTLMNDQDILLIRELSNGGFCAQVSERAFERLAIGDVYEGRIRYIGEVFGLWARVAWKSGNFIGFEIVRADPDTQTLIDRLLEPISIAASLAEVDANFLNDENNDKAWYHSESGADLFVWRDTDNAIRAWELNVSNIFVEWTKESGFLSGSLAPAGESLDLSMDSSKRKADDRLDERKKTFAVDVLMALQLPIRDELMETLVG